MPFQTQVFVPLQHAYMDFMSLTCVLYAGHIAKGDSRFHTSINRQLREGEACAAAQQILRGEPLSRGPSAAVKGMIWPSRIQIGGEHCLVFMAGLLALMCHLTAGLLPLGVTSHPTSLL